MSTGQRVEFLRVSRNCVIKVFEVVGRAAVAHSWPPSVHDTPWATRLVGCYDEPPSHHARGIIFQPSSIWTNALSSSPFYLDVRMDRVRSCI